MHTIGKYDALYQIWRWDNIQSNSVIFANEDVANLDDDEIRERDDAMKDTQKRQKPIGWQNLKMSGQYADYRIDVSWQVY